MSFLSGIKTFFSGSVSNVALTKAASVNDKKLDAQQDFNKTDENSCVEVANNLEKEDKTSFGDVMKTIGRVFLGIITLGISELVIGLVNKNSNKETDEVENNNSIDISKQEPKETENTETKKQEESNVKITKDNWGNEIKTYYDDNNNVVKKEYTKYGDKVVETYENGKIVSKTVGVGENISTTNYEYDKNGNLAIEKYEYKSAKYDDSIVSMVKTYDEYHSNGEPKQITTESVQKDGTKRSEKRLYDSSGFDHYVEYYENGKMTHKCECTTPNSNGSYKVTITHYKKDGVTVDYIEKDISQNINSD